MPGPDGTEKEGMSREEAEILSAVRGAALTPEMLGEEGDGDELNFSDDEYDPDVESLNNPDVETLPEPPLLGGKSARIEMYGNEADRPGRAVVAPMFAEAAQMPTAVQYRVWKWENGVPTGLGVIDIRAQEEDFIREFYDAMPKPGESRAQFLFRPIDIRGREIGKEFTKTISEHHAGLRRLREIKKQEREAAMTGTGRGWNDPLVIQGDNGAGASYAEEMGRMFEQAVESAEEQNRELRTALERERDRLRDEDKMRAEERVSMAERSANVVHVMTERLMASDRMRADEALKGQAQQSQLLLSTITTVFQQQQEAARQQSERVRESDSARMQQDREFFARQQTELEIRRQHEKDEAERRRAEERDAAERRSRYEKEEWERRREEERARLEAERQRMEEQRRYELEAMRIEAQRRDQEMQARRDAEKEEIRLRLEREKMDLDRQRDGMRDERERWRQELEEKRRQEQMDWERKMQAERDERERRERSERERWEREKLDLQHKQELDRQEWERKESSRREDMQRESEKRREELQIQLKQMESNATRDREHAERMMEMARLEREAQREAAQQRERTEREAREQADRDRQRQFDLQKFEMEQAKERDREHAERMMQMSKLQSSGGLGGLTEMLGMETPELLARIFGGGDEDGEGGGSWADAIPKVLGSLAELGKTALKTAETNSKAKRIPAVLPQGIPVQTAEGIRVIPADAIQRVSPVLSHPEPVHTMPATPRQPSAKPAPAEVKAPTTSPKAADEVGEEEAASPEYEAGRRVNTVERAKAAGMSLLDQKKVRQALRKLREKIEQVDEEDWLGLITESLMTSPKIAQYITFVTVYAAFAETGAAPSLCDAVVAAMRESGLVPDHVPYTEADYARLMKASKEKAAAAEKANAKAEEGAAEAAQVALAEADDEEEEAVVPAPTPAPTPAATVSPAATPAPTPSVPDSEVRKPRVPRVKK